VVDRLDARIRAVDAGLLGVPRIGENDRLVGQDEELAGVAGHPLLTVGQHEAGKVSAVLGAHAEVAVEPLGHQALTQLRQAPWSGGTVGRRPALPRRGTGRHRDARGVVHRPLTGCTHTA
jgi:hypothetical protein